MPTIEFYAKIPEDLKDVCKSFLPLLENHRFFALQGEMGVGKTTFINYLAEEMKIQDTISSPTFGYVNEYYSPVYGQIFHLDLYRIESEEEAYNIGIEEYIYNNAFVFIEWPEKIDNLLPENCVWIYFSKDEKGIRNIEINI